MGADEPSLYSRREKLSLQYAIRLAASPSNPAHEVTFPPNYVDLYEQKPKAIKSFGIRISPLLESANMKPQNILHNNSIGNKLLDSKPTIGEYQSVVRNIRKEEVVLA